jgi:plastocyanin
MARSALIVAAAAAAAALAAGATSGAVEVSGGAAAPAANRVPIASLRAKHRRPRVGQRIVLDTSRSRDPDGRIAHHLWDLDGDGVYERSTGSRARIRHAFKKPGKVRVGVVVIDDQGGSSIRTARFRVVRRDAKSSRARRLHDAKPAKRRRHRARVRAATLSEKHAPTVELPKASPTTSPSPTVHAAATSNAVRIVDFSFKPKSITVNVGDTVVWTNKDSVAHSATADNGDFDTGLLAQDVQGSYKFMKAGTFSYHCTPHDYMKASVTVTGSGGGSSPGSNQSDSGGTSNTSTGTTNNSSLPHTGLQIATVVLAGFILIGTGAALRRRLSRP